MTAAIVDIGSNSIKLLVATRGPAGRINALKQRTIDARISGGIGGSSPKLTGAAMAAGVDAVTALLADAAPYAPDRVVLVATSAVRDAGNGAEFREQIRAATGKSVRILGGDEEANLIGRGLTCDPALAGLSDFYVFDLGGGSLECLAFRSRQITQAVSLQLGCVRLLEKFVRDPSQAFSPTTAAAITDYTQRLIRDAGFGFNLGVDAAAVATGGTMTVARVILAAERGATLEGSDAEIALPDLRRLLHRMGSMPLAARQQIAGLPGSRADVMPTALATLIAVAELGGFQRYRHSLYNLRYGLADEALTG